MKKIFALILSLFLVVTLSINAFAFDTIDTHNNQSEELSYNSISETEANEDGVINKMLQDSKFPVMLILLIIVFVFMPIGCTAATILIIAKELSSPKRKNMKKTHYEEYNQNNYSYEANDIIKGN